MPTFLRSTVLGSLLASAALTIVPSVAAATNGVDLRVESPTGTLTEHVQYTHPTPIKASPKADCFGPGNEGSGAAHPVPGSPLSAVKHALRFRRSLRPFLVTDAFADSFGLGVCGIGGFEGKSDPPYDFWYVKINHKGALSPEDRLPRNGEVLYAYTTGTDPELKLFAPRVVGANAPYTVKVVEFDDSGARTPAQGAMVGGFGPTGANGQTTVTSPEGVARLTATREGSIDSNTRAVCAAGADGCSRPGKAIFGSTRADRIRSTAGADRIRAAGGDDRINIERGGRDRVVCGGGFDVVVKRKGDRNDRIASSCERLVRR